MPVALREADPRGRASCPSHEYMLAAGPCARQTLRYFLDGHSQAYLAGSELTSKMAKQPATSSGSQAQLSGLQAFFPLPVCSDGEAGSGMAGSTSPVRRESSPDSLQVSTPPQSEGLKAGPDQPAAHPFPIFEQPRTPLVEDVDTHSLSLSWFSVRQTASGGDIPEGLNPAPCGLGYSLDMQLLGTVRSHQTQP